MSLSADDDFLGATAQQARVAYATQQLNVCRNALQGCQADVGREVDAGEPRVQHELLYYTEQVARWQDYLVYLEKGTNAVESVQALDVPMSVFSPHCQV
jgi:hypothetical protein